MRIYKMKIFYVFFCVCGLFGKAQTNDDPVLFKSDLKKIIEPLTSNSIYLKFQVIANGQQAGPLNTYILKRKGDSYYTSNSAIEIINKNGYSLNIDHSHKIAILSKIDPINNNAADFAIPLLTGMDSLNFEKIKRKQDNSVLSYSFQIESVSYKIRYDTISKKILDYTLTAYDPSLRSTEVMVIKFIDQNLNFPFHAEDYPMEKYIDFLGAKPQMKPSYKQYQFILKA